MTGGGDSQSAHIRPVNYKIAYTEIVLLKARKCQADV